MMLGMISLFILFIFLVIAFFSKRKMILLGSIFFGIILLVLLLRSPHFWVILNNAISDTNKIEQIEIPGKLDLEKLDDSISVDLIIEHYGIYQLILYTEEDLQKMNNTYDGEICVSLYHDENMLWQKKYKNLKFGYYYQDDKKIMLVRLDNFEYPYKGRKDNLRLDISILRQSSENGLTGYLNAELRYVSF